MSDFHMPVGTHLLVELYGCSAFDFNKKDLMGLAFDTGAAPIKAMTHQFKPQGKSGFVIIEESHISIHTYPEFGYIAVDVFTCGDEADPYKAIKGLKKLFKPTYLLINDVNRGVSQ